MLVCPSLADLKHPKRCQHHQLCSSGCTGGGLNDKVTSVSSQSNHKAWQGHRWRSEGGAGWHPSISIPGWALSPAWPSSGQVSSSPWSCASLAASAWLPWCGICSHVDQQLQENSWSSRVTSCTPGMGREQRQPGITCEVPAPGEPPLLSRADTDCWGCRGVWVIQAHVG